MELPQKIYAEIQRFQDLSGKWLVDRNGKSIKMRKRTKVLFGDKDVLLGTVILTNPSPLKLRNNEEWRSFNRGSGEKHIITGTAKAEPALRIVTDIVNQAYRNSHKAYPSGYVNVYYVSNVVCSQKDRIPYTHHLVQQAIYQQKLEKGLLMAEQLKTLNELAATIKQSPFTVIGFKKDIFTEKSMEIIHFASHFSNVVYTESEGGWWDHPLRWGPNPELKQEVIQKLTKVLESNIGQEKRTTTPT